MAFTGVFVSFKSWFWIVVLGIVFLIHFTHSTTSTCKSTYINNSLNFAEEYDRLLAPELINNKPTIIQVNFFPERVNQLNVKKLDFEVQFYLELRWRDDRLNLSNITDGEFFVRSQIWVPALEYRNCRGCNLLAYNEALHSVSVKNGELSYVSYRRAKLICYYGFVMFPADKQRCAIELQAYDYENPIELQVGNTDFEMLSDIEPPEMRVTYVNVKKCPKPTLKIQDRSCLEFYFIFDRQLTFYISGAFFPSGIIVVISWMSFLVNPKTVGARVALGLTTTLALYTLLASIQRITPQVSYSMAIDIWMLVCIFYNMSTLIILMIAYLNLKNMPPPEKTTEKISTIVIPKHLRKRTKFDEWKESQDLNKTNNVKKPFPIDKWARILFPCSYMIFVVTFWVFLLFPRDKTT